MLEKFFPPIFKGLDISLAFKSHLSGHFLRNTVFILNFSLPHSLTKVKTGKENRTKFSIRTMWSLATQFSLRNSVLSQLTRYCPSHKNLFTGSPISAQYRTFVQWLWEVTAREACLSTPGSHFVTIRTTTWRWSKYIKESRQRDNHRETKLRP